jgi:ketosteroid isomerase-like protein
VKRVLSPVIVILALTISSHPQTGPDAGELTRLLNQFLAGASRNDPAIHERFWADDLIYTGSAGRRIGKADIIQGLRSAPGSRPSEPATTYTAEDIRIQQYGDTAVVAFRLVASTRRDGTTTEVANYLNTGTFLKSDGKWQAVSWQATRMPRPEEQAKKDVAAAESALHQAILNADVKKLELLTDDSFIWTHHTGEQVGRRQLIDQLAAGRLKYSRLATSSVTIMVYGDTAVVRGVSERQRSRVPGSDGPGDPSPFTAFYTVTFVNKDGVWKAVAMHSSRT